MKTIYSIITNTNDNYDIPNNELLAFEERQERLPALQLAAIYNDYRVLNDDEAKDCHLEEFIN